MAMMPANAKSVSIPAPVGGWDTREALADMPANHAVIMDNMFPANDKVIHRRGYESHATGCGSAVESLIEYTGVDGVGKLFAAAGTSIFSVTAAGAVGAAAVSGLTNSRWQQVQIGTAGGEFVIIVNGADTPRTFDGTSWASASITGPTAANLVWCNLHQRRLWFGEVDSLSAWYLPVNSISGAASEFSIAGVASLGGYIAGMGTWTRDGGAGVDDVAVFVTSKGEAIIYAGTDPSNASTWSLIGVFRIGNPIGRRFFKKAGADLIILTEDGAVGAATILPVDRAQADRVAITSQINRAFNDSVLSYVTAFGWDCFVYPRGTMLLFNVPQSLTDTTKKHQYVFNTLTKAPCRFTGIPALCWGLLDDRAYFGAPDGTVYLFDEGASDNGANIVSDLLPAYNHFKSPGQEKAFKMAEPIFESNGNPNAEIVLCVDYRQRDLPGTGQASQTTSGIWDSSLWDVGLWGSDSDIYRGWRGVSGIGRAAALRIKISDNTNRPSLIAINYIYVPGGII
jgi:hypothetical protein